MDAALTTICCPHCGGEGYLLALGGPGIYSARPGSHLPSESYLPCERCGGSGELEVCVHCLQPLVVIGGRELCACDVVARRAA